MNKIPQTEPERTQYAIDVMSRAKREEGEYTNVEYQERYSPNDAWSIASGPGWNWATRSYRIIEEPKVWYRALMNDDSVSKPCTTLENVKIVGGPNVTAIIKFTKYPPDGRIEREFVGLDK